MSSSGIAEFKKCECGYALITYVNQSEYNPNKVHYIYVDGHSGNYRQVFVCPGCRARLHYLKLED